MNNKTDICVWCFVDTDFEGRNSFRLITARYKKGSIEPYRRNSRACTMEQASRIAQAC